MFAWCLLHLRTQFVASKQASYKGLASSWARQHCPEKSVESEWNRHFLQYVTQDRSKWNHTPTCFFGTVLWWQLIAQPLCMLRLRHCSNCFTQRDQLSWHVKARQSLWAYFLPVSDPRVLNNCGSAYLDLNGPPEQPCDKGNKLEEWFDAKISKGQTQQETVSFLPMAHWFVSTSAIANRNQTWINDLCQT